MDFRYTDIEVNRFAENISSDHFGMDTEPTDKDLEALATFGQRLKFWRLRRGFLHQGKFATLAGVKQGSYSELESGESRAPSAAVLLKVCDLLGLQPQYLLNGVGPPQGLDFAAITGAEAQLVMIFRQLRPGMQHALLIDAHAMLNRPRNGDANVTASEVQPAQMSTSPKVTAGNIPVEQAARAPLRAVSTQTKPARLDGAKSLRGVHAREDHERDENKRLPGKKDGGGVAAAAARSRERADSRDSVCGETGAKAPRNGADRGISLGPLAGTRRGRPDHLPPASDGGDSRD